MGEAPAQHLVNVFYCLPTWCARDTSKWQSANFYCQQLRCASVLCIEKHACPSSRLLLLLTPLWHCVALFSGALSHMDTLSHLVM